MKNTATIEIERLAHAYPDGTRALDGVDLTVHEGERVALLGPNGAGKSTLLLHLNGVIMPTEGRVRIGDTVIGADTVRSVREQVGLVFQDPDDQLFMATVYDDVAFGPLNMGLPSAEVDERTHAALHDVGLAEVTSKSGQHLSFGQKKRVALATILAMRPKILVLDEPTSNLDPRAKREMTDLLDSLDVTMLVATHDMDLAWRLCKRAVVVDKGQIAADGTREEILTDAALLDLHGLELPYLAVREAAHDDLAGTIDR